MDFFKISSWLFSYNKWYEVDMIFSQGKVFVSDIFVREWVDPCKHSLQKWTDAVSEWNRCQLHVVKVGIGFDSVPVSTPYGMLLGMFWHCKIIAELNLLNFMYGNCTGCV